MFKTKLKNCAFQLSFIIAFSFIISSCKNEQRAAPLPDNIHDYVYAYTNGVISKADELRVRFANPVIEATEVGQALPSNLISLSPSIKGTGKWEDQQTLSFQPEGNFKSATSYVVSVELAQLFEDLPEELETFQFDFKTKSQGFNLSFEGLSPESISKPDKQLYTGIINTNDIVEADGLEKTLTAEQGGKALQINWEHSKNQRQHQFFVKNIVRKDNASKVLLKWNGSPINVSKKGEKEIEIPALGDFKVVDVIVNREGNSPFIQLNFSDPIQADQDLEGLIQIKGFNGDLDFVVNHHQILLYPKGNLRGTQTIQLSPGIKNIHEAKMQKSGVWTVQFEELQPQVQLVRKGVIMPNSEGLILPFRAVSLSAVEVEVFKIFDNNILQFLQTNELNGSDDLYRVGRVVLQEKVLLENLNPQASSFNWGNYALDLSKLFEADPKALYQVRIGFRPEYATIGCQAKKQDEVEVLRVANREGNEEIKSFWGDWYGINGYYDDYRWEHRNNPCQPAYYNYDRFVRSNVISSNVGIIAKGGKDNRYYVAVSNLLDAQPIGGVTINFYDFQQQLIRTTTTDNSGIAEVSLKRKPFAVIATSDNHNGYLKMSDGNSLSLSRFDVSGAVSQKGMKGFIYGERGVWRPGDSLFLNFVLESNGNMPKDHPITFELSDPRGQVMEKRTINQHVDNVYPILVATKQDDPTGNWIAKVKAGGATFQKVLKIETIKPNRLKINLDLGEEELTVSEIPKEVNLQVNWLHGAPGQNLDAKIEMQVHSKNTTFDNYNNYEFDDPARRFDSYPITIFEDAVNEQGQASFNLENIGNKQTFPGKLIAKLKCRAFEKGGDFSTYNTSVSYSPYNSYTGVLLPKNKYGSKRIEIGKEGNIRFVMLDDDGNPLKNKKLDVGLYRINWRWWWDRGWDDVSQFNRSNHYNAKETTSVTTNAKGEAIWSVKMEDWGRYLVRVCDPEGGHCSGDYFYSGYPWYGSEGQVNRQEAAMMAFTSNKTKYEVGEDIELSIPASESSTVLVTLENGEKVIDSFWGQAKKGDNTFTFKAIPTMAPTVYANVSLIQPHAQVENDLPIRMYGVLPISVEDPKTILDPKIKMPDELAPNQTFTVEVSENSGQDMVYTLAVVDDGLLDLTNFKTPNPHASFYAREALGVKTWDIYDHVLGAFGGELERVLAIGGDGDVRADQGNKNANRFKPVVRHIGPFYLNKGKKAKHKITMPNYVGSVRTMLVASNSKGAYGNTEKTTPVKKPLMLLATLPRVLGPKETLKMPISIFAMDKKVKNATIRVEESSGLINFPNGKTQTLNFSQPSEKMAYFDIEVGEGIGIAKFKVSVEGNGESATQEIELDVRNPNPLVTNVYSEVLNPGESWEESFELIGLKGTNGGILEVTNLPPIDLGRRLRYLIRYPHGCIEQTTSTGFPQLFVENLLELDDHQKTSIPRNIQATIDRLKKFQTSEGGFSYWPGNEDPSAWGSNYGGHFMLEAKEKGYFLPPNLLSNWVKFQKKRARSWKREDGGFNDHGIYNSKDLMQAYRLYTLAKAGEPELGAMNRMRELSNISVQAKWRLSAAYALIGKTEIAKQLINELPMTIEPYQELSYSYGSNVRDEAMILETLVLSGEMKKAALIVQNLAKELGADKWFSTQTTAYSLMAISKFAGEQSFDDKLAFEVQLGNKATQNAGSKTPVMQIQIPVEEMASKKVAIKNTTEGILYSRLILTGKPLIGDNTSKAENLNIEVKYVDVSGSTIDPSSITQGTDFIAEVRVKNPGSRGINYEELALTQIFPSGWEIINSRMDNFENLSRTNIPEYQDFRDDRVYTYFDLSRQQTQVYRIQLNAAYEGRYYLPTVSCEAMYDNTINARVPGQWIEVKKSSI